LASTRSRKIFLGRSLCPGARALKNRSGYFSRTGSDSLISRNRLAPYSNCDSIERSRLPWIGVPPGVSDAAARDRMFAETGAALLHEAQGRIFVNCATVSPRVHVDVERSAEARGASAIDNAVREAKSIGIDAAQTAALFKRALARWYPEPNDVKDGRS